MPYVTEAARQQVEHSGPETAGELNYAFTLIINDYLKRFGVSYSRINDVVGALECCKLEFNRRVVGPYEDTKITANGDVYDASVLSRPIPREG